MRTMIATDFEQNLPAPVRAGGEMRPGSPPRGRIPVLPWRDPHSVPPGDLAAYIGWLQRACAENPESASLHTCLGMAHAMNHDVYGSMDALEYAVAVEPDHFFAQMKYAELFYRLRALNRAEEETGKALDLAGHPWELSLARRQLQEIRRLKREGMLRPEWRGSLRRPAVLFAVMLLVFVVMGMLR